MKKLKNLLSLFILSLLGLSLAACSDDSEKSQSKSGDHIWKHQTDSLKTSKDVANQLQESLNQQKQSMEENN